LLWVLCGLLLVLYCDVMGREGGKETGFLERLSTALVWKRDGVVSALDTTWDSRRRWRRLLWLLKQVCRVSRQREGIS
jgi:hypothetical protein